MTTVNLYAVRCEALFASTVQRGDEPTPERVRQVVARTVRALGSRGCAACVAQAYGDDPFTALARMRWARAVVARTYVGHLADVSQPPTVETGCRSCARRGTVPVGGESDRTRGGV